MSIRYPSPTENPDAALRISRVNSTIAINAPFRILILKDRRAGHFRKSEGVARAIARRNAIELEYLPISTPLQVPGRLVSKLALSGVRPPRLLRWIWRIHVDQVTRPDLIISAGAETLAPNVLLMRHFRCRNLFIGSTRRIAPENFSAVLHENPDKGHLSRHIVLLSPSAVDPDACKRPLPIYSASSLTGRTAALLVGGPAPGYRFSTEDWQAVARLIEETAALGLKWIVSSSRRTPSRIASRLRSVAEALPGSVSFIDYGTNASGSADPAFNADVMLVTQDSNTMIAEAIASRRPVIVLSPNHTQRVENSLAALLKDKRAALIPMVASAPDCFVEAIQSIRPLEYNPLDVLYKRLETAGVIPSDLTGTPSPAQRR